jgi:SWIM zinc finger
MSTYLRESVLTNETDGIHLALATATGLAPGGLVVESPLFFSGLVAKPQITGPGILAVADVAASRYADLGVAAKLASIDPVVTAGGDRLRFESFSACNGVYARLDLLPAALGEAEVGFGTTNVDINLPLRTALARVNQADPLHLSVGTSELRVSSPSQTFVERKVKLPERWIRGLAEVPGLCAEMDQVCSLSGAEIAILLARLPRTQPPGDNLFLKRLGRTWHLSHRNLPGAIPLPGSARLRGSDRIARLATKLTIHQHQFGATAWVFHLDGAQFTLALSPNPFRGFSGEGTLLTLLTRSDAERTGREILGLLGWSPTVDATELANESGLDRATVRGGLAWLAASGRLGYDLVDGAWFHRELPIDAEKVLSRNPRLTAARRLVTAAKVHSSADGWLVNGDHGNYRVGLDNTCTCPWVAEHGGSRGPCKHLLAVAISLRDPIGEV